jgi:hypothetical protein
MSLLGASADDNPYMGVAHVAREPSEVGHGFKFEQTGFLSAGDVRDETAASQFEGLGDAQQ